MHVTAEVHPKRSEVSMNTLRSPLPYSKTDEKSYDLGVQRTVLVL